MSRPHTLIFWLLLAATICIDVVAFSNTHSASASEYLGPELVRTIICDALLSSQVSIVCIWAVLSTNRMLWLPAIAAALAATVTASLFDDATGSFATGCRLYLNQYGFEAALLLIFLWLFRGSRFWRRRTGATVWRFSLAQLLLVMTAAAVLSTTMRSGPFAEESRWTNIGFEFSVVVMAFVSAILWCFTWHWLLRFAATLGAALVFGATFAYFAEFGAAGYCIIGSHFLVQAIVLSAWLGWGPILPPVSATEQRYTGNLTPRPQ
jgi:hypothetical protein